ncbi:hypothetical protein HPB48_005739 [Haemaphysalis longicornis]|uniref:Nose resistant-to-fluoxetine protein N-terminal domain-containing protein n=1 Tax=Haemaphysalis longicornis TaxID=44386 RepID=A0A9J6FBZ5_HAELO|nr:hypothetical protein HPB48_005739 [Haemaphysalis longicornis]
MDSETVVDASGKIPSGFSDGSLAELGDYDLCLRVSVHKGGRPSAERLFRGQYCSFTLDPPLPPRPPVIRNTEPLLDTSILGQLHGIESFVTPILMKSLFGVEVVKEAADLSWGLYTTRLRIGICVPDQCSAPEIDRILQSGESLKAFISLSLPKATSAVFKVGDSKSRLKVFNGMRILGVFWVVTFHTYVYPDIGTYREYKAYIAFQP